MNLRILFPCLIFLFLPFSLMADDWRAELDKGYEWIFAEDWETANSYLLDIQNRTYEAEEWEAYFEACYMLAYVAEASGDYTTFLPLTTRLENSLSFESGFVPYLYLALANASTQQEQIGRALQMYQAADSCVSTHYPEEASARISALVGQGLLSKRIGDYAQAQLSYEQALQQIDTLSPSAPEYYTEERARVYQNLALLMQSQGDFAEAAAYYSLAKSEWKKVEASMRQIGELEINEAQLWLLDEKPDTAQLILENVIKYPELNQRDKGRVARFLAEIALQKGELGLAEVHVTASQKFVGPILPHPHLYYARLSMLSGQIEALKGRWPQAKSAFQHAISELVPSYSMNAPLSSFVPKESDSDIYLAEILLTYGKSFFEGYERVKDTSLLAIAWEANKLGRKVSDLLRSGVLQSESQFTHAQKWREGYEIGIAIALEKAEWEKDMDWKWEAFLLSARQKGLILREQLLRSRLRNQRLPEGLQQQYQYRITGLESLRQKRYQADDSLAKASFQDKYVQALLAFQTWEDSLKARYPQVYSLAPLPQITQARLREKLREERTLVEFFWGKSLGWRFTFRDGILEVRGMQLDSLQHSLAIYRSYLQREIPEDERVIAAGNYLSNALLPASYKSLYIIPDGPLSFLPFASLPFKNSFLGLHHPIAYGYGSFLLLEPSGNASKAPKSYAGWAPDYAMEGTSSWAPLMHNQAEVETGSGVWRGMSKTGHLATKASFLEEAETYSLLHLAAHAFAPKTAKEAGGLVFSGEEILYDYEVAPLPLSAEIAILSACETGYGPLQQGEGVMSLARAFRAAGCQSILMTQWPVDDEANRALIEQFLTHLKAGIPKDEALQMAQKAYFEASDRQHPYYWAGLVLVGEREVLKSDSPSYWLFIGLIFLILGVTGFVYRARNRSAKASE